MSRDTHRAGEEVVKAQTEMLGDEIMSFKATLSGAAPHTILFSAQGLPNMADVDYRVFPTGETASIVTVDESTIAETGFDLLNGADTEVVHIMVHGKIAGRNQV